MNFGIHNMSQGREREALLTECTFSSALRTKCHLRVFEGHMPIYYCTSLSENGPRLGTWHSACPNLSPTDAVSCGEKHSDRLILFACSPSPEQLWSLRYSQAIDFRSQPHRASSPICPESKSLPLLSSSSHRLEWVGFKRQEWSPITPPRGALSLRRDGVAGKVGRIMAD